MSGAVLEGQASFALRGHNPDVLTCIANLSNDEVFTPPELANQMLDTVADAWADAHDGASIWQNPDVTFLDPFTKSGVFLREIVRRLVDGLAEQIPDQQQRVDHRCQAAGPAGHGPGLPRQHAQSAGREERHAQRHQRDVQRQEPGVEGGDQFGGGHGPRIIGRIDQSSYRDRTP